MPRHLIGDAHEWINEIPTVPTHSLVKLQPSQRSWDSTYVSLCHISLKYYNISCFFLLIIIFIYTYKK